MTNLELLKPVPIFGTNNISKFGGQLSFQQGRERSFRINFRNFGDFKCRLKPCRILGIAQPQLIIYRSYCVV